MNPLTMFQGDDRLTAGEAPAASLAIRAKVPDATVVLRAYDDRLIIEVTVPLIGEDMHVDRVHRFGTTRDGEWLSVNEGLVEVDGFTPTQLWASYAQVLANQIDAQRAGYCSGEIVDGTTIHYTYEGACPVHPDAPLLDGEPVTGTWDRTVGHTIWIHGETTDLGSDQYGNDVITPHRVNVVGTVKSFDPVAGMRLSHHGSILMAGPFSERQLQDLTVRMFP